MDVLNLNHSPEKGVVWELPILSRRAQAMCRTCYDKCFTSPRGLRQRRVAQRFVFSQASSVHRPFVKRATQVAEYDLQCKKRSSNGHTASDENRYAAMVSYDGG